ncbi:Coenzyme F420 hydrogenase/dehydrogenase, beta subunit C-terminal domain [Labilibaculum euxinus]|uniref:4Fe-4S dicluster domain-containing protein n=1 Tax=Labilibaculum euxinus TaxID=2686357 RepID=A0A7M4DAF6_9BACT|nr:Coenzyme F420 hydrogenase/dehydrogenase, beta subunit C-terminal domain [Labilibaculum euxinus]MUP39635.1 4Fe-4S dicluster domain-containing protein [Labilibaculum euxinus]MVB08840.1 4Fe-4S dicluster domain-containing protein [Labilibaculum euxinus]
MNSIPSVIDLVVNNDLCIGCGLCTYKCPNNALGMEWNDYGFFVPVQIGACNNAGACLSVCPFNPEPEKEVQTEDELSDIFLSDAISSHPKIGKYNGIYVGYSNEFRLTSSSGGIATFVLTNLLERGIIQHIFSVKESDIHGTHYEYAISNSKQELIAGSKTKYYPVTLSSVFDKIDELEGKVAIVGVACFIKAIRLAQHSNPSLKKKITFLVGIICGGVKSRFFTEYLSSSAGVTKDLYYKPEFRIKDTSSTAGDYSFGCFSKKDNQKKTVKMKSVGDMWGTGLFKANACDYCDDVTTELADISLGDAWLSPFMQDGKGTNVIVTRSTLAEKVIIDGINAGKIQLEKLSLDRFLDSQKGSFNHRHTGLPYRIKQANKNGLVVPPKRIDRCGSSTLDFRIVQYYRMKVRIISLDMWKDNADSTIFNDKMKRILSTLKRFTTIYHYKRALFSKDVLNKIACRLRS